MSKTSSEIREQKQQAGAQGQLRGGLPFTVEAALTHGSSWASLKPMVKTGLPTPVSDKMQANPTQSSSTSTHQFLKEE